MNQTFQVPKRKYDTFAYFISCLVRQTNYVIRITLYRITNTDAKWSRDSAEVNPSSLLTRDSLTALQLLQRVQLGDADLEQSFFRAVEGKQSTSLTGYNERRVAVTRGYKCALKHRGSAKISPA